VSVNEKNFKILTKKFGLNTTEVTVQNTIEDLLNTHPLMVLAVVKRHCQMQVDGVPLTMRKGATVAMPFSFYLNAKRDSNTRIVNLKPSKHKFFNSFRRYRGEDLTNKKLLVSRTGGIGDIMFSQPVIKYLKNKYQGLKIAYCCAPRFQSLFKSWPKGLVDEVLTMPYSKTILDQTDYHLTFEGVIERCRESETVNAYDLYTRMAYLDVDHSKEENRPILIPNQEIVEKIKDKLPENFIIAQIRASSPIRMMSAEKWIDVIKSFNDKGVSVVFIDQPERSNMYEQIIDFGKLDRSLTLNLTKVSEDIHHAIAMMSLSKGIIGVDSSHLHLGNALGKKVFGIYGPFKADLRLKYYRDASWIETTECECNKQPCFFHGHEQHLCEYLINGQVPNCLNSINTDEIIKKSLLFFKLDLGVTLNA